LYEESFKGFNPRCQRLVENEIKIEAMEIGRASLHLPNGKDKGYL